jgi:hypothetical protein
VVRDFMVNIMALETLTIKQSDKGQSSNVSEQASAQNQVDNTKPGERNQSNEAHTAALAQSGALPHISLVDGGDQDSYLSNSFQSDFDSAKSVFHEAAPVGKDIATGAYDEVKDNPGKVAGELAKGIAYGAVGVAAIAGLPELAVAGAVAGVAVGANALYDHAGGVMHDAGVVAHADQYSQKEVADAHIGLQSVGASGIDGAADAVGALVGGGLVAPLVGEAGAAGGAVAREAGGEVPVSAENPVISAPRRIRPGGAMNPNDPILTTMPDIYS